MKGPARNEEEGDESEKVGDVSGVRWEEVCKVAR